MRHAPGTVLQRLFAIRQTHLAAGYMDPLEGRKRVWLAVKGLKRRYGAGRRKLPVTPAIRGTLAPETQPDDAILWAALNLDFFYLMRVGEYAHSGGWDTRTVLTPADLRPQRGGVPCEYREAEELLLYFKKSKADQEGAGAMRNHYATGEDLCPVQAMRWVHQHLGARMRAVPHLPVFRYQSGAPLMRAQLQAVLERAAVALGLPPDRYRTHSLRIGGATALCHINPDTEVIKRWGRWSSGAFPG